MKHIFKIFVFILCLLSIHNNASAGFFGKIKSYFTRPPSTKTISFPEITGSYAVGTIAYHWVDRNRLEKHVANTTTKRELMIQFWYPAIKTPQSRSEKYQGEALKKELVEEDLPPDELRGLDRIYSHAISQAPISSTLQKYPVVILSHGFGMTRFSYSAFCENLASNGYIVIGIDHPYAAEFVRFPNGKEIRQHAKTLEDKLEEIDTCINDVRFVLDQLEQINQEYSTSMFREKLDLSNIGIFGHSLGGAVTTHICRIEQRIKAGINIAGPIFAPQKAASFNKPFMIMQGQEEINILLPPITDTRLKELGLTKAQASIAGFTEKYRQAILGVRKFFNELKENKYLITIKKMEHNGFSDSTWIKELPIFKFYEIDFGSTSLDGYKMIHILNDYIIWFFDTYLKQKDSQFPEYPEAIIER